MPITDSINTSIDTVQLQLDSVRLADSLCRVDSITSIDSLRNADALFLRSMSGFVGESIPQTPANQDWIFAVLLLLFGFIVLTSYRSIISIKQLISEYFTNKDRNSIFSKTSIDSAEQKTIFLIFSILSLSLAAMLIFNNSNFAFSFGLYMKFLLLISLFLFIKYIFVKLIEFVFFKINALKTLFDSYVYVLFFVSFAISIFTAISLYANNFFRTDLGLIALIFTAIGLIMFTIRLVQIFLHKTIVILYLLLYLCTLEIAPLILLIEAFRTTAFNV